MKRRRDVKLPYIFSEIADQPLCWAKALDEASTFVDVLPAYGEKVAVVGCGTSWFMAMVYAELREAAGHGLTDAFCCSEFPVDRRYDMILAICRSGTTTDVLKLLSATDIPTVAITACPHESIESVADHIVDLSFADEQSVVQTRFATTALTLLRAHEGLVPSSLVSDAESVLDTDVAPLMSMEQITFLGHGWTVGLAYEAALKCREAALMWTEAYPAEDYRHGPIAIAQNGRAVVVFGKSPVGLVDEIRAKGGIVIEDPSRDPQAFLVFVQRLAALRALHLGIDPDHPRGLTRSVILDDDK